MRHDTCVTRGYLGRATHKFPGNVFTDFFLATNRLLTISCDGLHDIVMISQRSERFVIPDMYTFREKLTRFCHDQVEKKQPNKRQQHVS